ncbi:MAG: YihY/virulence factor BrkB family protein [Melioribacteraceae bacterium]|nr:YihY/virulence factor BrkB family protein [Melioribacteraceae bacterium]
MKLNNFFKNVWSFIREVVDKFIDDKAPKLGASLSFYTIFSLAPLLLIVIAIAGLAFGDQAARGELFFQIQGLMGKDGAEIVQTAIKNSNQESSGILALIISFVTLVISATVVFIELQESLNMVWKVRASSERSIIKGLVFDRIQSFALIITTGFLLLVSLVVSAVLSYISNRINENFITIPVFVLDLVNAFISLTVIFILFTMLFKILPDVNIKWRDVWVGGLVTSVLFVLGKYLIGLYLGNSALSSTYGAAGSLVVLLLWIYYSAQILFLGAEFTFVYANKFGAGYRPRAKFHIYETNPITGEKNNLEEKKKAENDHNGRISQLSKN